MESEATVYHSTGFLREQAIEAFTTWAVRVCPEEADKWVSDFEATMLIDEALADENGGLS